MSSLPAISVKTRIRGGFVLVLVVLLAVAGGGLWGMSQLRGTVDRLDDVTRATLRLQDIERNVVGVRRNALIFLTSGTPQALARVRELEAELRPALATAREEARTPETRAGVEGMIRLFDRYFVNFGRILTLREQREALVRSGTDTLGREVSAAFDRLVTARSEARGLDGLIVATRAQALFLRAQVAVQRTQARFDETAAAQALRLAAEAHTVLSDAARVETRSPELDALAAMVDRYRQTFAEQVDLTRTLDTLVNVETAGIAAEFGTLAGSVKKAERAALDQLSVDAQASIRGQEWFDVILSSAGLLLGALLAWRVAHSIVVPIGRMTGAMTRLAEGDHGVVVPALGTRDEIGEMAKAVQVFKQNAIDKLRMEAEQRGAEEVARAAEIEARKRETAIVAEVAAVAKAASGGDLDRRIDLAGKDGFLLSLCEGVNTLVSLTGIALKDVAGVLSAVAGGDLTRRITGDYAGLFGQLKGDVNRTADKLFEVVSNIKEAAGHITGAASEVAAGSQDLSERSEQQASALEETAASMEELAATVRQNARNAQQANQLAAGAREVAASGGQVVTDAIGAMSRIETSSQKIEDIVGMIDEIAFQTNLLALNAAVEAARAGDAGKGFAVVAQEVRNLAQRSAQASKEIKGLIAESSTQVRSGADLVKGAGRTLDEILGSVKRVADIVAEIASASAEQASGIDQVNEAITQMDEMTQQNAALVEESTAAAHALEQQAGELTRQIAFFDIGTGGRRR